MSRSTPRASFPLSDQPQSVSDPLAAGQAAWHGLEPLEPRLLLAADLFITGPVPDAGGEEPLPPGPIAVEPVIEINGNTIGSFGPGQPVNVDFVIGNNGDEEVENPQVAFIWDDDNDIENGYVQIIDIRTIDTTVDAAGEEGPGSAAIDDIQIFLPSTLPNLQEDEEGNPIPGYLHVVADPNNFLAEDNEANNWTEHEPAEIFVQNRFVDHVGAGFDVGSQIPWAGSSFDVTYSLRQSAPFLTFPFRVSFYLSKQKPGQDVDEMTQDPDTIDPGEDLFLGAQDWHSGITGDTTGTRTVTLQLPGRDNEWWVNDSGTTPNTIYHVGMIIDRIAEDKTEGEFGDTDAPFRINNDNLWFNEDNWGNPGERMITTPDQSEDGGFYAFNLNAEPVLITYDVTPMRIWVWPDLFADNIVLNRTDVQPGQNVNVTVDILNDSKIPARPFDVTFHISRDGLIDAQEDPEIGRFRFNSGLPAANLLTGDPFSRTITQQVTLPGQNNPFWDEVGAGEYFIGVVVIPPIFPDDPASDDPFTTEEIDGGYQDNSNRGLDLDFAALEVSGIPEVFDGDVDLLALSLAGPQGQTFNPGDTVNLDFEVMNNNVDDLPIPFNVRFFLSTDTIIDPREDLPLNNPGFQGLPAGGTTGVLSQSVTLPDLSNPIWANGSGTFYIGMFVDPNDAVKETDEANNANLGEEIDIFPVMVELNLPPASSDTAGNNKNSARNLGNLGRRNTVVNEFVGTNDRFDFFRVRMPRNGRLSLSLFATQEVSRVVVLNSGRGVAARTPRGTPSTAIPQRINEFLPKGEYFIKVVARPGVQVPYELRVRRAGGGGGGGGRNVSLTTADVAQRQSASQPAPTPLANRAASLLSDDDGGPSHAIDPLAGLLGDYVGRG